MHVRYLQVLLGVQLFNENKNEMWTIMNNIHQYVPNATYQVVHQGEYEAITDKSVWCRPIDSVLKLRCTCNDDNPIG